MAGFADKLQEVLTAVSRLADLEKRYSSSAKETRDELRSVVAEIRMLDRRLSVLETRYDGLSQQTATEARAAAQSAATMAVAGELRAIGERIVRLESAAGPSSPNRIAPPQT